MILGDYKREKADPMTQAYANSKQRRNNPNSIKNHIREQNHRHPLIKRLSDSCLGCIYMNYDIRFIENSHLLSQKPVRWRLPGMCWLIFGKTKYYQSSKLIMTAIIDR